MDFNLKIDEICDIAKEAGRIILAHVGGGHSFKNDGTEISDADLRANDYICENLARSHPEIAIVSEENDSKSNDDAFASGLFFVIDPLDGTRNFLQGGKNYTVNIALIDRGSAVFGVIYLPAKDILYYTKNGKSFMIEGGVEREITVSNRIKNLKMVLTKREPESSQIRALQLDVAEYKNISSSYKFCLIAQGEADIYVRMARLKMWDVAAGDAIVKCAGGRVVDRKNCENLRYFGDFLVDEFAAGGLETLLLLK